MGNMGNVMDGSFFADYCTMVEQIHSYNENARVYAVLPVPSLAKTQEAWDTPGSINEVRLRIVREVIKAVGETYPYVDVLDMNRAFLDVIEGETLAEVDESRYNADNPAIVKNTGELPSGFNSYATPNGIYLYDNSLGNGSGTISIDGIHPGQAGAQRMAKTVAAALEGEKKYLNPEYDWSVDVPEIATGEMRKQEEAEPGKDGRIGDADGNGALSLVDALAALKISVEAEPEKETAAYRSADVDQDGVVDTSDVLAILMKVNGKEVPGIRWMEPVSSSKPAQDNTFNLFDAEWIKDDAYEVSFDS